MIFLLFTGTSSLIIYISKIQKTQKYRQLCTMYSLNIIRISKSSCIPYSGYVLYAVQLFVQCLTNPGEKGEGRGDVSEGGLSLYKSSFSRFKRPWWRISVIPIIAQCPGLLNVWVIWKTTFCEGLGSDWITGFDKIAHNPKGICSRYSGCGMSILI